MEELQQNMRLIIAGKKSLSVDAVCSNIMSHDPRGANYLVYLDKEEYGVGTINSKFIRTKGEKVHEVRKLFPHTSSVTMQAFYYDYEPPSFEVISTTLDGTTLTLDISGEDDLDKVELIVLSSIAV